MHLDTVRPPGRQERPIFFDASLSRWRRSLLALFLLAALFLALFAASGSGLLHPPLLTSPLPRPAAATIDDELLPFGASSPQPTARSSGEPALFAFSTPGNPALLPSLQKHGAYLTGLLPAWQHISDAGSLSSDDAASWQEMQGYLSRNLAWLPLFPVVSDLSPTDEAYPPGRLRRLLVSPLLRQRLEAELLARALEAKVAGVTVDFRQAQKEEGYGLFMSELQAALHLHRLRLFQVMPWDGSGSAYQAGSDLTLFRQARPGTPGPVAGMSAYRSLLATHLHEGTLSGYALPITAWSYDWGGTSSEPESLSFLEALRQIQEHGGQVSIDPYSLTPYARYTDASGIGHQLWLSDGLTTFNQLRVVGAYPAASLVLDELGEEDPSSWQILQSPSNLDAQSAHRLEEVQPDYDLRVTGEGEISQLVATPQTGQREVLYDVGSGLVTAERFQHFPATYVVRQAGRPDPKKIALTFDDGPDPGYTPDVLDVLQDYHVPATFFVIGDAARKEPGLMRRIYDEGHEVGNHTYFHSNVSLISPTQLRLETVATERTIEGLVGRRSLLFRPPYAVDIQPSSQAQLGPLALTSSMGYYTVGMNIDPNDWRPGRSAEAIAHDVLSQAKAQAGNVVLLHDGGGNREQTVKALPLIIESLRKEGFELVTASDLLGMSRDEVMPPLGPSAAKLAVADRLAISLLNGMDGLVYGLFLFSVVVGLLRLVLVAGLAVRQRRRRGVATLPSLPSVEVLVPAYNEEKVIVASIERILCSRYPDYSVLVIDDGSTDRTLPLLRSHYNNHPRVRVLSKANGGKAAALNYGLARCRAEVVVTVDADTWLDPDALSFLAPHFANPRVAAVAGNAKVGNRLNLLTRWQALEYIMGQNLDRRAFDLLNCIGVVPGAIGAWRRAAVWRAGGFSHRTLAEDTDLTLSLLASGHRIVYEDRACAYTEAPAGLGPFLRQRFRWVYGTLQAVWQYRGALCRSRFGALGWVTLPNLILFQLFLPVIGPLMDLLLFVSFGEVAWQRYQHPETYSAASLKKIALYYLFFFCLEAFNGLLALTLERTEEWRLLLWLPLQRFCYRQLLYWSVLQALACALHGRVVGWGKLERKATVSAPTLSAPS